MKPSRYYFWGAGIFFLALWLIAPLTTNEWRSVGIKETASPALIMILYVLYLLPQKAPLSLLSLALIGLICILLVKGYLLSGKER